MITKDFEKKITTLSTQHIYNRAVGSFLLILLNCVEDLEDSQISQSYTVPTELIDLKKEIHNQIDGLKIILADKEVKASALENAFEMKEKLTNIYETIYRYSAQWNTISTIVSDEVAIRKYKDNPINDKTLDFAAFYADCVEFIQTSESFAEQKSHIGQLFKCVPFKMERNKYFDLVNDSLALAFAEQSEEAVNFSLETFKNTCAPDKSSTYGKFFPEIAEAISEKLAIKPTTLSDEELDEAFTDLNTIFEGLEEIENYFQDIYGAINSLIILFYLNFSFDDLTENNFGYSDVYYKVCEMIKNPEDKTFIETVCTMLEEYILPVIDETNELNKKETKLLEKIVEETELSEDLSKTLATEGFVRATFYGDLNEDIFEFNINPDSEIASEEFKKEKFGEFIEFMREYFSSLPFTLRKSAMQLLLSSLPLAMNLDEIMDYIKNGIDGSSVFEQRLLIINKVGMIFEDNDFKYMEDEDEYEYHHHHDENCGCGHDHHHHHHDENCGCGHHH